MLPPIHRTKVPVRSGVLALAATLLSLLAQVFLAPALRAQVLLDQVPPLESTQSAIGARAERLLTEQTLPVGSERISSARVLPYLYTRRNNLPVWTSPAMVADLLSAVRESEADGLRPADYHLRCLDSLAWLVAESPVLSPDLLADFDILLTDALIRLGYHLYFGKVDAATLDANWNLALPLEGFDPVSQIEAAVAGRELRGFLGKLAPGHPLYARLKAALAQYRKIQASGGWPQIPSGPALKPGMSDPRVPLIRERLAITGDHPPLTPADTGLTFDGSTVDAVNSFQRRHQGSGDSTLGSRMLAQMNVPVSERIEQMRVDLERMRWVMHAIPDTLVLVNVAAARVFYVVNGRNVWTTRAVVGKTGRESPIFADSIRYLVFNPTWTVPPGILDKDIIPAARRGVPVLRKKNLKIYDAGGREVEQSSVNWSRYTGNSLPYAVRQEPGPNNALGRVKFMFPNRHSVYLHDTPSKDLFEKDVRLFSSGCIRIEHPLEMAALLLRDTVRWNEARISAVLRSMKETAVYLPRPVPVFLLYSTSSVTPEGQIVFTEDVYVRNPPILEALDRPFEYDLRRIEAIRKALPDPGTP